MSGAMGSICFRLMLLIDYIYVRCARKDMSLINLKDTSSCLMHARLVPSRDVPHMVVNWE